MTPQAWRVGTLNNQDNKKRRSGPKVDKDQQILPWADEQPPLVAKLKLIEWNVTGFSFVRWAQLRELAAAIVYCGLRTGCRASNGALLLKANANRPDPVIGSESVLKVVLRLGRDYGLLKSQKQTDDRGNAPPLRWVDADTVDALLELTRELDTKNYLKPQGNEKSDPTPVLSQSYPSPHCLYITTYQTNETNETLRSTVDQKKAWTEEQIDRVRQECKRVHRALGKPKLNNDGLRGDRDLIAKACYLVLVAREFPQAWLENAITGVIETKPGSIFACFQKLLYVWKNEAEQDRDNHTAKVKRALARVTVPDELLCRPSRPVAADERLCAGGDA